MEQGDTDDCGSVQSLVEDSDQDSNVTQSPSILHGLPMLVRPAGLLKDILSPVIPVLSSALRKKQLKPDKPSSWRSPGRYGSLSRVQDGDGDYTEHIQATFAHSSISGTKEEDVEDEEGIGVDSEMLVNCLKSSGSSAKKDFYLDKDKDTLNEAQYDADDNDEDYHDHSKICSRNSESKSDSKNLEYSAEIDSKSCDKQRVTQEAYMTVPCPLEEDVHQSQPGNSAPTELSAFIPDERISQVDFMSSLELDLASPKIKCSNSERDLESGNRQEKVCQQDVSKKCLSGQKVGICDIETQEFSQKSDKIQRNDEPLCQINDDNDDINNGLVLGGTQNSSVSKNDDRVSRTKKGSTSRCALVGSSSDSDRTVSRDELAGGKAQSGSESEDSDCTQASQSLLGSTLPFSNATRAGMQRNHDLHLPSTHIRGKPKGGMTAPSKDLQVENVQSSLRKTQSAWKAPFKDAGGTVLSTASQYIPANGFNGKVTVDNVSNKDGRSEGEDDGEEEESLDFGSSISTLSDLVLDTTDAKVITRRHEREMEVLKKISVKQKGITDKLDTLDEMQKQKIKERVCEVLNTLQPLLLQLSQSHKRERAYLVHEFTKRGIKKSTKASLKQRLTMLSSRQKCLLESFKTHKAINQQLQGCGTKSSSLAHKESLNSQLQSSAPTCTKEGLSSQSSMFSRSQSLSKSSSSTQASSPAERVKNQRECRGSLVGVATLGSPRGRNTKMNSRSSSRSSSASSQLLDPLKQNREKGMEGTDAVKSAVGEYGKRRKRTESSGREVYDLDPQNTPDAKKMKLNSAVPYQRKAPPGGERENQALRNVGDFCRSLSVQRVFPSDVSLEQERGSTSQTPSIATALTSAWSPGDSAAAKRNSTKKTSAAQSASKLVWMAAGEGKEVTRHDSDAQIGEKITSNSGAIIGDKIISNSRAVIGDKIVSNSRAVISDKIISNSRAVKGAIAENTSTQTSSSVNVTPTSNRTSELSHTDRTVGVKSFTSAESTKGSDCQTKIGPGFGNCVTQIGSKTPIGLKVPVPDWLSPGSSVQSVNPSVQKGARKTATVTSTVVRATVPDWLSPGSSVQSVNPVIQRTTSKTGIQIGSKTPIGLKVPVPDWLSPGSSVQSVNPSVQKGARKTATVTSTVVRATVPDWLSPGSSVQSVNPVTQRSATKTGAKTNVGGNISVPVSSSQCSSNRTSMQNDQTCGKNTGKGNTVVARPKAHRPIQYSQNVPPTGQISTGGIPGLRSLLVADPLSGHAQYNLPPPPSRGVVSQQPVSSLGKKNNEPIEILTSVDQNRSAVSNRLPDLRDFIKARVLHPGTNVLSIKDQGCTYYGSLTEQGFIRGVGGEMFRTPMMWCTAFLSANLNSSSFSRQTAYKKVKYKGKPLSEIQLPRQETNASSHVFPAGTLQASQEESQRMTSVNIPSLEETLKKCVVRLIDDAELVPSWTYLPENFWSANFRKVDIPKELVSCLDTWS